MNVIHSINRLEKTQKIISIDGILAPDEIQHLFMMKTLSRVGRIRNVFNLIRSHGDVIVIIVPTALGYLRIE